MNVMAPTEPWSPYHGVSWGLHEETEATKTPEKNFSKMLRTTNLTCNFKTLWPLFEVIPGQWIMVLL